MSTVIIEGHADACVCCGNLEAATLSCRIRGGTATLCGYSEFTSASTPPKKYRIKTFSGGWNTVFYNGTCATTRGTDTAAYSGFNEYSATNCSINVGSLEVYDSDNCGTAPPPVHIEGPAPETWSTGAGGVFNVVNTQTTSSQVPNGNCGSQSVCGSTRRAFGGGALMQLSAEATNDEAISRLLAGGGGTWGSWIVQGATGCTGSPPSCCLARYEQRVSGFNFIYQESQFRVTASGLDPSTTYTARVEIFRRTYGSGSYALYSTIIVSDTTDGSGNFSADGDVPNDEGFESYADNAFIVIPS